MNDEQILRNQVTEPLNFVWIPTGSAWGEPTGIVGYWDGDTENDAPIIDFPEGRVRLSSQYTKMYDPTGDEIDAMLGDNERWAERIEERT